LLDWSLVTNKTRGSMFYFRPLVVDQVDSAVQGKFFPVS